MVTSSDYKRLIKDFPLISEQMNKKRLDIILGELNAVLKDELPGEVVEFGCYNGTTSLFLRRLLNLYDNTKQLHLYDSFSGLPDKSIKDASVAGSDFKAGELKVSKRELIRNFKRANLKLPYIHKGWFSDLTAKEVPEQICFGFADGDFYDSIIDSLNIIWPRLVTKGRIVIDDYERSGLPGVSRAVNEFFADKSVRIIHKDNLALIRKP